MQLKWVDLLFIALVVALAIATLDRYDKTRTRHQKVAIHYSDGKAITETAKKEPCGEEEKK